MNITISVPTVEDVPMMVSWEKGNRELWGSDHEEGYTPEALREWIRDPKLDIILVAKDGEFLVGSCLVHWMRDWAYLSVLFVLPEYRKKGIGKMLLSHVSNILKERKCSLLALQVNEDNKEAQRFYSRLGFQNGFRFVWMDKKIR